VPDGNDTAGDRFTDRRDFNFDSHALELPKLIERRGRDAFRQPKSPMGFVGYI
jgi:hypothetical protein